MAVVVGGMNCTEVQRVTRVNRPTLECVMGKQRVGFKNMTISVAAQHASIDAATEQLVALCSRNNYGAVDELCLPCPTGAYCDGGLAQPIALTGWFNLNGTGDQCPPERLHRTHCDYIVPCEPSIACLGNNTCATGTPR